jgi:hypothetical protein
VREASQQFNSDINGNTENYIPYLAYPKARLSLVALLTHYCCPPVHDKGMADDSGCRF